VPDLELRELSRQSNELHAGRPGNRNLTPGKARDFTLVYCSDLLRLTRPSIWGTGPYSPSGTKEIADHAIALTSGKLEL
jgi:hypothetical protein